MLFILFTATSTATRVSSSIKIKLPQIQLSKLCLSSIQKIAQAGIYDDEPVYYPTPYLNDVKSITRVDQLDNP